MYSLFAYIPASEVSVKYNMVNLEHASELLGFS